MPTCCRSRSSSSSSVAPAACWVRCLAASSSAFSTILARRSSRSSPTSSSSCRCSSSCSSVRRACSAGTRHDSVGRALALAFGARHRAAVDRQRLLRQHRQPDSDLRHLCTWAQRARGLCRARLARPCRALRCRMLCRGLARGRRLGPLARGAPRARRNYRDISGFRRAVAARDGHRLSHDHPSDRADPVGSRLSLDRPHRWRQRHQRAVAASAVFIRSPFGASLRGTRDQPRRMTALGYNVWLIRFLAFLFSGFWSGVAGLLFCYYNQFVSPNVLALSSSAEALLMVISGGTGTLLGPIAGATLVVIMKNVASAYIERWNFLLGAIFVAIVVFMPEGLVPGSVRMWRWTWSLLRRPRAGAALRAGGGRTG